MRIEQQLITQDQPPMTTIKVIIKNKLELWQVVRDGKVLHTCMSKGGIVSWVSYMRRKTQTEGHI